MNSTPQNNFVTKRNISNLAYAKSDFNYAPDIQARIAVAQRQQVVGVNRRTALRSKYRLHIPLGNLFWGNLFWGNLFWCTPVLVHSVLGQTHSALQGFLPLAATNRDLAREIVGIGPDAPDEGGCASGQPRQSDEIESG